jgi:hypothetical protein
MRLDIVAQAIEGLGFMASSAWTHRGHILLIEWTSAKLCGPFKTYSKRI